MIKTIDKFIIFSLSFLIYSNIFIYLSTAHIISLTNVHLFVITLIFTIYFIIKYFDFSFLNIHLLKWVMFYSFILLLWYIFPNNELTVEEFRRKILSVFAIIIFTLFIYHDNNKLKTVKLAILITVILSVINNIYEFINPSAFFPIDSNIGVFGRSAGFYINPTGSGKLILIGLIFSIDLIDKKYRHWFLFFAFIGIVLTFSRSAILGFLLFYLYLSYKKQIDLKFSFLLPFLISIIFLMSLPFLTNYVESTYGRGAQNIINRINWFIDPEKHADASQREREFVALEALNKFIEHPILGNGLGSTRPGRWRARVSAHNIYLTNMAEIGILGLFIFPLLIYSLISQAQNNAKSIVYGFGFLLLYFGFFSHILLDEFSLLFIYALVANISYKSKYSD